jgi:hypothetical protein
MAAVTSSQEALTAIVRSPDGVRFTASAHSPVALAAEIVAYVRERCEYVLWPDAAAHVRALIANDEPDAAIATYFANVGERWDEERLEVRGAAILA